MLQRRGVAPPHASAVTILPGRRLAKSNESLIHQFLLCGNCGPLARLTRRGAARSYIPTWVKTAVDTWTAAAVITHGPIFRAINKTGRVWGDGMSPKVLWDVVRAAAARAGIDKLAPHDLRRTCARLCHLAGGQLDQIQFLLGHVSIQTTERYLGCKQKLRSAVNNRLGIEPDVD